MSLPHHEMPGYDPAKELAVKSRLLDQFLNMDRPSYSDGQATPNDQGDLSYAMATDDRKRIIWIKFGKPIESIGLDVQAATELCDQLTERILALRGIK